MERRDDTRCWRRFFAFSVALVVTTHFIFAQETVLTPAGNNLYNTGYDGATLAGNNQPATHYALLGYGNGVACQANPLANARRTK